MALKALIGGILAAGVSVVVAEETPPVELARAPAVTTTTDPPAGKFLPASRPNGDWIAPTTTSVVEDPQPMLQPVTTEPEPEPTTTTTTAPPPPPTPTTAHVHPEPTPEPPAATEGPQAGVWAALSECESGGDWGTATGNGFFGGLQFHPQTWRGHGGGEFAPSAHQASPAEQIVVAERVLASQGWGAWPSCSRKLGLR